MFLFDRLEKAAKVDSLFQNQNRQVRGPAGAAASAPDAKASSEKPEGAQSKKHGEKLPAPDPKSLESLFQGMVDPAVPDSKKKKSSKAAESDDKPADHKPDSHEGHEKSHAKEAAPAGGPGMAAPAT